MTFLVDNQLPLSFARFLAQRGHACQHVLALGLAQAPDVEIWKYATEHQMVLISKDEDFFNLAGRPDSAAQLIWVRVGNCRSSALLSAVEHAWPRIEACLSAGDRVIEIR